MADKYVFISEPLPIGSLACRKLIIRGPPTTADNSSSGFTQTVLRARELIFTFPEVKSLDVVLNAVFYNAALSTNSAVRWQ
jgi:hypothetical protein